jgi:hypothetical protein
VNSDGIDASLFSSLTIALFIHRPLQ